MILTGLQEGFFHKKTELTFEEESSKMLHLENNLDTSESRTEVPGKFLLVVLERDGEYQLDRSCEK
jgi:hypothetical protein